MADLYDLYNRLAYLVIAGIVANPEVAENLVQEAFLQAWNRSDELTGEDRAIERWLMSIARNCALDYVGRHAGSEVKQTFHDPAQSKLTQGNVKKQIKSALSWLRGHGARSRKVAGLS